MLTLIVRSRCTRPAPLQVRQGLLTTRPKPWQAGQVRSIVKKPCCALTLPIPEQVVQVCGLVPASAPVPLQLSQATDPGTRIGTQTGRQFRLKGKGMPPLRGQGPMGDLFVEVVVETPVSLTKKQQELLREFEKAGSEQNSPETTSFFARVKEFFNDAKD